AGGSPSGTVAREESGAGRTGRWRARAGRGPGAPPPIGSIVLPVLRIGRTMFLPTIRGAPTVTLSLRASCAGSSRRRVTKRKPSVIPGRLAASTGTETATMLADSEPPGAGLRNVTVTLPPAPAGGGDAGRPVVTNARRPLC